MPMDERGFAEWFKRLMGVEPDSPVSNDPHDYPRYARILDDEILLKLTQQGRGTEEYKALLLEAQALSEKLEVVSSRLQAGKAEIFYLLKRLYPEVAGGAVGWRQHEGQSYFVGWDPQ